MYTQETRIIRHSVLCGEIVKPLAGSYFTFEYISRLSPFRHFFAPPSIPLQGYLPALMPFSLLLVVTHGIPASGGGHCWRNDGPVQVREADKQGNSKDSKGVENQDH